MSQEPDKQEPEVIEHRGWKIEYSKDAKWVASKKAKIGYDTLWNRDTVEQLKVDIDSYMEGEQ